MVVKLLATFLIITQLVENCGPFETKMPLTTQKDNVKDEYLGTWYVYPKKGIELTKIDKRTFNITGFEIVDGKKKLSPDSGVGYFTNLGGKNYIVFEASAVYYFAPYVPSDGKQNFILRINPDDEIHERISAITNNDELQKQVIALFRNDSGDDRIEITRTPPKE